MSHETKNHTKIYLFNKRINYCHFRKSSIIRHSFSLTICALNVNLKKIVRFSFVM